MVPGWKSEFEKLTRKEAGLMTSLFRHHLERGDLAEYIEKTAEELDQNQVQNLIDELHDIEKQSDEEDFSPRMRDLHRSIAILLKLKLRNQKDTDW